MEHMITIWGKMTSADILIKGIVPYRLPQNEGTYIIACKLFITHRYDRT